MDASSATAGHCRSRRSCPAGAQLARVPDARHERSLPRVKPAGAADESAEVLPRPDEIAGDDYDVLPREPPLIEGQVALPVAIALHGVILRWRLGWSKR